MVESFPHNSVRHDRRCYAEDFKGFYSTLYCNGVFVQPADGIMALSAQNMDIRIKPGSFFLNGMIGRADGTDVVTLSYGEELPRYDMIVLRYSAEDRAVSITVIEGDAEENPVYPGLVRNGSVWDLGLAAVYVPANASEITNADITDLRPFGEYCGWVTNSAGTAADVGELLAPVYAAIYKMIGDMGQSNHVTVNLADETAREEIRHIKNRLSMTDI